jgi:hypothetical protein
MTNLLWALICFSWLPNNEPDLAGYRLYCGGQPGIYTNVIQIPSTRTNACVSVQRGVTNYFVLTAVNSAGLESLPTAELAYFKPQRQLAIQESSDLANWTAIPGAVWTPEIGDGKRFYRVVWR